MTIRQRTGRRHVHGLLQGKGLSPGCHRLRADGALISAARLSAFRGLSVSGASGVESWAGR